MHVLKCDYGPDKGLKDSEMSLLLQQLIQLRVMIYLNIKFQFEQFFPLIQHEYIVPINTVYNNDFGVLYIQKYYSSGSLRDHIYGVVSFDFLSI